MEALKQTSLADALLIEHTALTELDGILTLINWNAIEAKLSDLHTSKRGGRAQPPLMMFKALLLQMWYSLSDPALEQQLARDLLFRRFMGLSLDQRIPDHSSFWRFRQSISKDGRLERSRLLQDNSVYRLEKARSSTKNNEKQH